MNTTRGFIGPVLLIIIAALLVGGGAYIYKNQKISETSENPSLSKLTPYEATQFTIGLPEGWVV